MRPQPNETDDQLNRQHRLLRRGTALLQQGNPEKAAVLLSRAYQIAPDNVDIALNLSGAYILSKQFKRARPVLERLSEQEPHNEMVWTNLGAAYLGNPVLARDEDQQKAIAAFKQALSVNPKAPNVAYNLGLIYRDRREYAAAAEWFDQAVQTNPRDRDAHTMLARMNAFLAGDA